MYYVSVCQGVKRCIYAFIQLFSSSSMCSCVAVLATTLSTIYSCQFTCAICVYTLYPRCAVHAQYSRLGCAPCRSVVSHVTPHQTSSHTGPGRCFCNSRPVCDQKATQEPGDSLGYDSFARLRVSKSYVQRSEC